jgi:cell division septation protein DedD
MEQFNQYEEVAEKSVYLVHLDNTRIVILVSVFAAIIALTFLIGMKFGTDSSQSPLSSTQNQVLESQMNAQSDDDLDKLLSESDSLSTLESLDESLMKESELLTPDTAENIVPKEPETKPTTKKSTQSKPTAKKSEPKSVKPVSGTTPPVTPVTRTTQDAEKSGFSIQIASFDSRTKAAAESSSINSQNFNSYIAAATVNGKTFYRVKVGPFANKTEAFATLSNIHNTTKYKESYITFEK